MGHAEEDQAAQSLRPLRRSSRGGEEAATPLVLPDLLQLIPSLRPRAISRGAAAATLAADGALSPEWQAALQGSGRARAAVTGRPGSEGDGLLAAAARRDSASGSVPAPLAAARRVRDSVRAADLGCSAGREWVANIVQRYEARIEALEDEVRSGCLGNLRETLLVGECKAQRQLSARQGAALLALQKRVVSAHFEGGGGAKETGGGARDRGQIDALQSQVLRLQGAVENAKIKAKMAEQQAEEHKQKAERVTGDLSAKRRECLALGEKLAEAQDVQVATEKARAATAAELARVRSESEQVEAKLQKRYDELQGLCKEREEDLQRQVRQAQYDMRNAAGNLKRDMLEMQQKQALQQAELEGELLGLRQELQNAVAERDRYEQKMKDAEQTAARVEDFRKTIEDKVNTLDCELEHKIVGAAVDRMQQADADKPGTGAVAAKLSRVKGRKAKQGIEKEPDAPGSPLTPGTESLPRLPSNLAAEWDGEGAEPTGTASQQLAILRRNIAIAQRTRNAVGIMAGSRREHDLLLHRIGHAALTMRATVEMLAQHDAELIALRAKHSQLQNDAAERQAKHEEMEQALRSEIQRVTIESEANFKKLSTLAKRLKQAGELKEEEAQELDDQEADMAQRRAQLEKELHLSPKLPNPAKRFLERMEENRKEQEKRWRRKKIQIVTTRAKNLEEAMDFCAKEEGAGSDAAASEDDALPRSPTFSPVGSPTHQQGLLPSPSSQLLAGAAPAQVQDSAAAAAASIGNAHARAVAQMLRAVKKSQPPQSIMDAAIEGAGHALQRNVRETAVLVQAWLTRHANKTQFQQAAPSLGGRQATVLTSQPGATGAGAPGLTIGGGGIGVGGQKLGSAGRGRGGPQGRPQGPQREALSFMSAAADRMMQAFDGGMGSSQIVHTASGRLGTSMRR
eukprot:TRINITY_DN49991_c0_g1_i1.p1 TRINITY_DN49991_c0_g1~~TRINITY_DN49991_c0_g1_i1.p1  ORF type:complete len:940 (+),score=371.89 TRINITY_DN49991_c0_g1_i1:83-2821(+)